MNEDDEDYLTKKDIVDYFDAKYFVFDEEKDGNAYSVFTQLFEKLDNEEEM